MEETTRDFNLKVVFFAVMIVVRTFFLTYLKKNPILHTQILYFIFSFSVAFVSPFAGFQSFFCAFFPSLRRPVILAVFSV